MCSQRERLGGHTADADIGRLGLMAEGSKLDLRCDRVTDRSVCAGSLAVLMKHAQQL